MQKQQRTSAGATPSPRPALPCALPCALLCALLCAPLSACRAPSASAPPPAEGVGPREAATPMSAEEEERLRYVLVRYADVWEGLAARRLGDAKLAAGGVSQAAQMARGKTPAHLDEPLTLSFSAAELLRGSATLTEARRHFEVMSAAVTRLGRAAPGARGALTLRYCPAAPGEEVTRLWAQPAGEARSPYAAPPPAPSGAAPAPCGREAAW